MLRTAVILASLILLATALPVEAQIVDSPLLDRTPVASLLGKFIHEGPASPTCMPDDIICEITCGKILGFNEDEYEVAVEPQDPSVTVGPAPGLGTWGPTLGSYTLCI